MPLRPHLAELVYQRAAYFARWQLPPDHRSSHQVIRRGARHWRRSSASVAAEKPPGLLFLMNLADRI
jgi:hypothetical protein